MARILHLIASNHRRGAETFAVELGEHLRIAGHEIRVLAVQGTDGPGRLDVEIAGRGRWDPRALVRVTSGARWADTVVSFGSTSLMLGAAAAWSTRTPFVYRNIGDPSVWGRARFADLRIGVPVRSASRVVALYPDAAGTLIHRYRVRPERIRVIPRGVPADHFRPATMPERARACAALGLDPTLDWVAYVGALSPEKDPLLAVAALDELPDRVGLVVAGSGPLESEMRAAASSRGSRCHLLGSVDDVRPVYASSSALVLPSHTEGIPGSAIEAGLAGLPVVAFRVGGVGSVVEDGVTGRLVDVRTPAAVAHAILQVLEPHTDLGKAARQRCEQIFSMTSVGADWVKVHEDLAASRSGVRTGAPR